MIAGLGLLDALQVLGELALGEEGRSVDACEHRARGVPPPVGACDRLQLERAHALGARRVGPATEVGERPVGVQRHASQRSCRVARRHEVVDQLDLVVLSLADEALARLGRRDVLALEELARLDVGAHAFFDLREVGLRDHCAFRELEVVVEAVGDRRPDRDLDAVIQLHHRRGEHVRGVVADQRERRLTALGCDDRKARAVGQRAREVAQLALAV